MTEPIKPNQARVAAAMKVAEGAAERYPHSDTCMTFHFLAAQVTWQEGQIDRLKETLRKVQWYDHTGGTGKWHHQCVGCDHDHGADGKSHAADCPVDNVLGEPAKEKTT